MNKFPNGVIYFLYYLYPKILYILSKWEYVFFIFMQVMWHVVERWISRLNPNC